METLPVKFVSPSFVSLRNLIETNCPFRAGTRSDSALPFTDSSQEQSRSSPDPSSLVFSPSCSLLFVTDSQFPHSRIPFSEEDVLYLFEGMLLASSLSYFF